MSSQWVRMGTLTRQVSKKLDQTDTIFLICTFPVEGRLISFALLIVPCLTLCMGHISLLKVPDVWDECCWFLNCKHEALAGELLISENGFCKHVGQLFQCHFLHHFPSLSFCVLVWLEFIWVWPYSLITLDDVNGTLGRWIYGDCNKEHYELGSH